MLMALATLSNPVSSALAQVTATNPGLMQPNGRTGTGGTTALASKKSEAKPYWKDLTAEQQNSLTPLASNWSSLSRERKRKWLELSKNYPTLPPAEQARLHGRMIEWVSLSQQQRAQARLNYAETKQLTPAQKTATWQAYQALSSEEKQKLASKARGKTPGVAAAVKPASPEKLAVMPVTKPTPRQPQKLAGTTHAVGHHTLLPQANSPAEPAVEQKH